MDQADLKTACIELANDVNLGAIYARYGTPPLWERKPGFATLLQIILEQQVSLASAKACFDKLKIYVKKVTPENVLSLSDVELKAIGFSRQKTEYARNLSTAILEGKFDVQGLALLSDADARSELTKLKGIGNWTSDIYLLMALLRRDVMPRGDIALHSAWTMVSGESRPDADWFLAIAERWRPNRSTAARLLWHFYLSERRERVLGVKKR